MICLKGSEQLRCKCLHKWSWSLLHGFYLARDCLISRLEWRYYCPACFLTLRQQVCKSHQSWKFSQKISVDQNWLGLRGLTRRLICYMLILIKEKMPQINENNYYCYHIILWTTYFRKICQPLTDPIHSWIVITNTYFNQLFSKNIFGNGPTLSIRQDHKLRC